jgi:prepilin-type N-terminal cleavage/methylation domain-containing protein
MDFPPIPFRGEPRRRLGLPSQRRSGLTLIELLAVIAVVAVLASLLLVGLHRAQESGRTISCANNLHQLALASSVYSLDNNSRLPFFLDWLSTQRGDLTTGSLFPYLRNKTVYLCPTDRIALGSIGPMPDVSASRHPVPTRDYSYGMNCCLCHEGDVSKHIAPARTLFMMEAALVRNDLSGQVGPVLANSVLSSRHNGRGQLLFCDMHLECINGAAAQKLEKKRLFWFPTSDLTARGGDIGSMLDPD